MRGEGRGVCGVSVNEYSCAHGAQINFGYLTPYSTYDFRGPAISLIAAAGEAGKIPVFLLNLNYSVYFYICLEVEDQTEIQ